MFRFETLKAKSLFMKKLFEGVSLKGIVKPGEAYIFNEHQSTGYEPEPIDILYLIRSEDDLIQALEMELIIVLSDLYEIRKFLGFQKVTEDCYRFKALCYQKEDRKQVEYRIYLHRIKSFNERLARVKELWGVS